MKLETEPMLVGTMCSGTDIYIKESMALKLMFACERSPWNKAFLARESEPHACIFENIGVPKSNDDACPAGSRPRGTG